MKTFIIKYVSESQPINVEFFDNIGDKLEGRDMSLAESDQFTEAVVNLSDGESIKIS